MKTLKLSLATVVALASVALAGLPAWAADSGGPKGPGRLQVDSIQVGTKAGPLVVRVRAGVFARVSMRVNGRRVRHPFEQAGRHAQAIELRTADGLRAGPNRLRIRAERGGTAYVAKRTVSLPGHLLHADAGPDAGAAVSVHSQVGTEPRASSPVGLTHQWRIVKRPHGAKATLRRRDEPQPLLHAKHPGTYVLGLEVGSDEPGPSSFDRVIVPVAPPDPPIGAPIDTIDPTGAIAIADRSFGANASGLAYVVLERTTRQVVRDGSGAEVAGSVTNDAAGIGKLADLAKVYAKNNYMQYLMIVSGRSGIPTAQLDTFAQMAKALGAGRLSPESYAGLELGRQFSIIGIPGAPAGAATVRVPSRFHSSTSGGLIGYLQKNQSVNADGTPVYDFADPEHPAFDTRAEGSTATANKMVVNGITYDGVLSEGATAGFHVVVLENLTLKPLDNLVIPTNGGSGTDRARQGAAATALAAALDRRGGPTVLVQSIGRPKGAGPEWDDVVGQLGRLGANRLLVYALDGTTEYALVGRLGSEQPPAESSSAYDRGSATAPQYPSARLIGVLSRTRDSSFEPTVSSTPSAATPEGSVNLRLVKAAYQPRTAWPPLAPPNAKPGEEAKVQQWICEQLGFCKPQDSCQSVRACYWDSYNDVDWGTKQAQVAKLDYPRGKGFEPETLTTAKNALFAEIGAVIEVRHYLTRLQEPFLQSEARSYVDLKRISDEIWDTVQRPGVDNSLSYGLMFVGKIASLGGFAGPPMSGIAAGISAIFALASYLSNKQGGPILGGEIRAKASELGDQIFERINLAARTTTGLGKLIVSDYGKLIEVNAHVHDREWKLPEPENALIPLQNASKQWFYEALVPTAYPFLIRGPGLNARSIDCALGGGRDAWPRQPDETQLVATVGYDGGGSPTRAVFFFTLGIGGGSNPPAEIGQRMFRPREAAQSGLGMDKLQFFTPRVWGGKIAHAVGGTIECMLSWLPPKY